MTVSSGTARNDYTGNGATDTYSYGFLIFAGGDLLVTQRDDEGNESTLAEGTDYTVSGVGNAAGGEITLTAGNLADGHKLSIRRKVSLLQETDYRNQSGFFSETIEDALDRLTMIAQQLQDQLDRALMLRETDYGASVALPQPSAGSAIAWNSDGDGLENIDPGSTELAVPADSSVTLAKLANDVTYRVDTLAELRLLAAAYRTVLVRGHSAAGDGGGGLFRWDAASTDTDNDGTIVKRTDTATGRYVRMYAGELSVLWFGATGDGATDDRAAIQAALDQADTDGGGVVVFPLGTYLVTITAIGEALQAYSGTRLVGQGGATIKWSWGGGPLLAIINQSDVQVRGLRFQYAGDFDESDFPANGDYFDHGSVHAGPAWVGCIIGHGSSRMLFEDLIIEGATPATSVMFQGIGFRGTKGGDLMAGNVVHNCIVDDCVMGIDVAEQKGLRISSVVRHRYNDIWTGGPGHVIYHVAEGTVSEDVTVTDIVDGGEPGRTDQDHDGSTLSLKRIDRLVLSGVVSHNPGGVLTTDNVNHGRYSDIVWQSDIDAPEWVTATAYAEGDFVINSAKQEYVALNAGTSGAGEPTGTGEVVDNDITWKSINLLPALQASVQDVSTVQAFNHFSDITLVHLNRHDSTLSMQDAAKNANFIFENIAISRQCDYAADNIVEIRCRGCTVRGLSVERLGTASNVPLQVGSSSARVWVDLELRGDVLRENWTVADTANQCTVRVRPHPVRLVDDAPSEDRNTGLDDANNPEIWNLVQQPGGFFSIDLGTTTDPSHDFYLPGAGVYIVAANFTASGKEHSIGALWLVCWHDGASNDYTHTQQLGTTFKKGTVFTTPGPTLAVTARGQVTAALDASVVSGDYRAEYGWFKLSAINMD